jgi:hypothetical protein
MAYYQGLLIHKYDDMIVCEVYPVFLRALNFDEFNGLEFVSFTSIEKNEDDNSNGSNWTGFANEDNSKSIIFVRRTIV